MINIPFWQSLIFQPIRVVINYFRVIADRRSSDLIVGLKYRVLKYERTADIPPMKKRKELNYYAIFIHR